MACAVPLSGGGGNRMACAMPLRAVGGGRERSFGRFRFCDGRKGNMLQKIDLVTGRGSACSADIEQAVTAVVILSNVWQIGKGIALIRHASLLTPEVVT